VWKDNGKEYLSSSIKLKAKILIVQLRTSSHYLGYDTSRWVIPKEDSEEIICIFCNKEVVETKSHFIKECAAYESICYQCNNNLKVNKISQNNKFLSPYP